ncbi:MAG: alpha-hydroxy-acid oxidizing protein [Halomonas sp.]|nr:alpha-hydroxy-acid oxidizing protein [Halomonas sp.]
MTKKRLPNSVFEYVYGGSDDEHTLRHNRVEFDQYRFKPKTMANVGTRDLSTTLFGHSCQMPLAIGPTGFNGMLTRDGCLKPSW